MTANWRIIEGDARVRLRELPDRSAQTCITSPPYSTTSHEYVFLLAKQRHYLYDADAIGEPAVSLEPGHPSFRRAAYGRTGEPGRGERRNKRSVWTASSTRYKGTHVATCSPQLIEPMVLASSVPGGLDDPRAVVLDPFAGASTTGIVAVRLGRAFVGVELNPSYVQQSHERMCADAPLLHAAVEPPDAQHAQLTIDGGAVPHPPRAA